MRHRTGTWWAFTLLLALSLPIAGRAQGPTAIPPGWKVGQKVGFTVQRTVELHADDTTDVVSTATLAGTLTVDKRTAEHFVITYRGTPDPLPMHAEDAPQDARTDTLLRRLHALYQAVMALPVSYRVSPQGMVMAMDDPDGLMDDMARAMQNAFRSLPDADLMYLLDMGVDSLVRARLEDLVDMQVNTLNLLFMGHGVAFPATGTQHSKVVYDDGPMGSGGMPVTGWVEVGTVERAPERLVGRVAQTYDRAELARAMRDRYAGVELAPHQVDMQEERVFTFDLAIGWIVHITEEVRFTAPGMRSRSTQTTRLWPE